MSKHLERKVSTCFEHFVRPQFGRVAPIVLWRAVVRVGSELVVRYYDELSVAMQDEAQGAVFVELKMFEQG